MQEIAQQGELGVDMPVHLAREGPREVEPPQPVEGASPPRPARGDDVAEAHVPAAGLQAQGQPDRQPQSPATQLPDELLAGDHLDDLGGHAHVPGPDVLVHDDDVADVTRA